MKIPYSLQNVCLKDPKSAKILTLIQNSGTNVLAAKYENKALISDKHDRDINMD